MKLICAAALGAVALAVISSAVTAAADDHYGAIAYSTDNGMYGYTYDYTALSSAEMDALKNCGDAACMIILWFKNSWGALAIGDGNAYGAATAASKDDAETSAMTFCSQQAKNCKVAQWVCSSQ